MSESQSQLVWRFLYAEVRRYRVFLSVLYLVALVGAAATFGPNNAPELAVFMLCPYVLLMCYIAGYFWRGVRREEGILDLLATPIGSAAYAGAFCRLFFWFIASGMAVFLLAIFGLFDWPRNRLYDTATFYLFVLLVGSALFWSSIFGIRRVILVFALPCILVIAMNVYHEVVFQRLGRNAMLPQYRPLMNEMNMHVKWCIAICGVFLLSSVIYHICRTRFSYVEILRARLT